VKPILVIVGLFWKDKEGQPMVQTEEGHVDLLKEISAFEDSVVDLSVHHYPPGPPDPTAVGGGCCKWGEGCPFGHAEDPEYMFSFQSEGNLSLDEEGVNVGDLAVPFQFMEGHHGRLVILRELEIPSGVPEDLGSIGDLEAEAQQLEALLSGLREIL
jgi:hypothetical protein